MLETPADGRTVGLGRGVGRGEPLPLVLVPLVLVPLVLVPLLTVPGPLVPGPVRRASRRGSKVGTGRSSPTTRGSRRLGADTAGELAGKSLLLGAASTSSAGSGASPRSPPPSSPLNDKEDDLMPSHVVFNFLINMFVCVHCAKWHTERINPILIVFFI